MPFAPSLDDRTFDDLFQEARSRIPLYTPEWTDWNESDPGITLLQLHSWLTETILYRLNQVPDLTYLKFLQLLGVEPRPAQPAQADLTFTLRKNADQPEALIPKGVVVGVSARNLPAPVFFETDRALIAINARLDRLIQTSGLSASNTPPPQTTDVTQANNVDGQVFFPFRDATTKAPSAHNTGLMLAFSSPLPFSREEIGLQFYLAEEGQAILAPPDDSTCGPLTASEQSPQLDWEWWDGLTWDRLNVTGDETQSLTRSGQVYLKVPGQIPAVPAHAVRAEPTALPARLKDVAGLDELTDAQRNSLANLSPVTPVEALAALSLAALIALLWPKPTDTPNADLARRILADAKRLSQQASPLYYWLRVVFRSGEYTRAPKIDRVVTNTVRATAALTVNDEAVGASDGTPNQVMRLGHAPVLADPPLQLEVDEGDGPRPWSQAPDFAGSAEDSRDFVLNRATGEIHFGDGRRGRIPVAGQFNVIARTYRYGGGSAGNVGIGTITEIATPVTDVESVTNYRSALGGQDEEPLSDTRLRAAHGVLKAHDRAVTVDDFTFLAEETPGALIARAFTQVAPAVLLHDADILKLADLAAALRASAPLSRYIYRRLTLSTQTLLSQSSTVDGILRRALVDELNQIIVGEGIYEAARFKTVTLQPITQALLGQQPRGDDLALLNRLLLQDAYAGQIQPLLPLWGGRTIQVVVVPQSADAKPTPSEAARELVCRYLDERRLITTQVQVTGPQYHDIDVHLAVWATETADLKAVKTRIEARLRAYFHPLRGGPRGAGWPFGQSVYYSELLREIMLLPDVLRVDDMALWKLIERWPSQDEANTRRDALRVTLAAQRQQAPNACLPTYQSLRVVQPGETRDQPVREEFYVAAVYDCCDLPVASGALIALRQPYVSVSYAPWRGGR